MLNPTGTYTCLRTISHYLGPLYVAGERNIRRTEGPRGKKQVRAQPRHAAGTCNAINAMGSRPRPGRRIRGHLRKSVGDKSLAVFFYVEERSRVCVRISWHPGGSLKPRRAGATAQRSSGPGRACLRMAGACCLPEKPSPRPSCPDAQRRCGEAATQGSRQHRRCCPETCTDTKPRLIRNVLDGQQGCSYDIYATIYC
jgi:hypothetical protein